MNPPLSSEARQRLDRYLDAVDATLRNEGMPRDERMAIVDELANQAMEMLPQHTAGRPATGQDVEVVVSQLDPPEAYASRPGSLTAAPERMPIAETSASPSPRGSYSALAITAFFCSVGWIVIPLILITSGRNTALISPLLLLALVAPILGFCALHQIKHTHPPLQGRGMATFAAILTPTLFGAVLLSAVFILLLRFANFSAARSTGFTVGLHQGMAGESSSLATAFLLWLLFPLTVIGIPVLYGQAVYRYAYNLPPAPRSRCGRWSLRCWLAALLTLLLSSISLPFTLAGMVPLLAILATGIFVLGFGLGLRQLGSVSGLSGTLLNGCSLILMLFSLLRVF